MSIAGRLNGPALFAAVTLALLAAVAPAFAATPYGAQTREAIRKLGEASELMNAGRTEEASAAVRGVGQSFQALARIALEYRQIAVREHGRCITRVGELDVRTNDLYAQQAEANRKIDELTGSIASAETAEGLTSTELARLNALVGETVRHLREREARLEEMRTWWWVPGYGQYLAIRTLADDDLGNYQRTITDLEDQNRRLVANRDFLNQSRAMMRDLAAERERATALNASLAAMRSASQARLAELNRVAVFLTDADVFWGLAVNLLEVDGESFVRRMIIIQDVLGRTVRTPSLNAPEETQTAPLERKLIEFADSLDGQTGFLLDDTTDFCGGPALEANARVTPIRACNIDSITAYYEIVDPRTCSFRYANPPGCPPPATAVDLSEASLERGRGRGVWSRSSGQNWIGRPATSPCAIGGAIYYGKVYNAEQCEAACQGDAACLIWSFNTNNGFMPDSIGQCWGGAESLPPNKSVWGGFVSGGIR